MKTAVVLFNLGGPDSLYAVKPFLFRMFNDPAIIHLPQPFRFLFAKTISFLRARKARDIYRHIGGKSPLLEQTQAQAEALEKMLAREGEYKVFVSMRYWHPTSNLVAKNVKAWAPNHILLLPLYPQYSTATTASSFEDWDQSAKEAELNTPATRLCCYPTDLSFIAAHAKTIRETYWKAAEDGKPRVLFSAHGLPKRTIAKGDPYQWQVEKTVAAIVQVLSINDLDFKICYQSRVGPMAWLGPPTDKEILSAAQDKVPVVIVPVAFVSEHSETLVELDRDYRKIAEDNDVPGYWRVPALGVHELFIEALADLCRGADRAAVVHSFTKERYCPMQFGKCACIV